MHRPPRRMLKVVVAGGIALVNSGSMLLLACGSEQVGSASSERFPDEGEPGDTGRWFPREGPDAARFPTEGPDAEVSDGDGGDASDAAASDGGDE